MVRSQTKLRMQSTAKCNKDIEKQTHTRTTTRAFNRHIWTGKKELDKTQLFFVYVPFLHAHSLDAREHTQSELSPDILSLVTQNCTHAYAYLVWSCIQHAYQQHTELQKKVYTHNSVRHEHKYFMYAIRKSSRARAVALVFGIRCKHFVLIFWRLFHLPLSLSVCLSHLLIRFLPSANEKPCVFGRREKTEEMCKREQKCPKVQLSWSETKQWTARFCSRKSQMAKKTKMQNQNFF